MATELGQAYVQIMPSAKGIGGAISGTLNDEMGGVGQNAGGTLGGNIISKLKGVLVAAGVGKIITSGINQGGELEQNLGGMESVFGRFAKNLQSSASEAYKNMGLSASDYMATANKMGSLFQGSGLSQQKSLEMTTQAMQRAADVASVMGIDTTQAMESIAGAAKGNFTMMDNLGVAMNATTLKAYALEKGINFEWNTASQAEKSELAMKMFLDRTSQYAGNFARESKETFSGSLGAMKASFQDLLATVTTGGDWNAALSGLMTSTVDFVRNLMPMLSGILRELPTILLNVVTEIGPQLLSGGVQMVAEVISGWAAKLPEMIPQVVSMVFSVVNTLIENLPLLVSAGADLIVGLAKGLIEGIPALIEQVPTIINSLVSALLEMIPTIIKSGVELLTSLVKDLPKIITAIVAAIPEIIRGILEAIVKSIPQLIQAGVELFTSLITNLPEIIITIITAVPEIVLGLVEAITGNLDLIIQAGVDLFTAIITNLPQIIWEIIKAVPKIIVAIVKAFGNLMWKIVEVGADIVSGIWKGISSGISWLWEKITGWISGIWDGIKKFFGIKSPSKKFAWMGEMIDRGLAEGITDNVRPVANAMDQLSETVERSFESDIAFRVAEPKSINGLSASVTSGLAISGDKSDQALIDYGRLAVSVVSAFVDAGIAVKVDNREFGRLVAGYA